MGNVMVLSIADYYGASERPSSVVYCNIIGGHQTKKIPR